MDRQTDTRTENKVISQASPYYFFKGSRLIEWKGKDMIRGSTKGKWEVRGLRMRRLGQKGKV
jgi:hypothetical protein